MYSILHPLDILRGYLAWFIILFTLCICKRRLLHTHISAPIFFSPLCFTTIHNNNYRINKANPAEKCKLPRCFIAVALRQFAAYLACVFGLRVDTVAATAGEIDFCESAGKTPNCWCSVNCWDDPSTLRLFLSFMWLIHWRNGLRRWYMNSRERSDTVLHSTRPLAARFDNRCDTVDFISIVFIAKNLLALRLALDVFAYRQLLVNCQKSTSFTIP